METEETKKYSQIVKELNITTYRMNLLEAKYTKEIWTDPTLDKEKLKKAELTLRLDEDIEYKRLLEQYWELESQRQEYKHT